MLWITAPLVALLLVLVALSAGNRGSVGEYKLRRQQMVHEQIEARGVSDARILRVFSEVPRHELVPAALREAAYEDRPLPIGFGQTISQPYIVALMTELADVQAGEKVLDIGTGSGYQAAVLAALGARVYSIEIVPELAARARDDLARIGFAVEVRTGDGFVGWPEEAPFDAIVLAAAPAQLPPALPDQLAPGGRIVAPLGQATQVLRVFTRTADGMESRDVLPVRFVPMTGRAARPPQSSTVKE
jgi:protein-L-isoaspartate(D-aspartate) O-methyltransferase